MKSSRTDAAAQDRLTNAGPVEAANLVLRFVLELAMLAALGYWGFHTGHSPAADIGLGIGAPLVAAVLWGILAAPNSTRRLRGASLTAVQVALLGSGAVALIAAGSTVPGIVFAVVVVVNAALLELFEGHH